MKLKSLKNFDVLIVIASLVLIFSFYGKIVFSPNQYMFNDTGDGLKNYYTLAYQVKNDSSFTELGGMNYPYGEHFFYTDSHPIVSIVIKSIAKVYPAVVDYSVGVINFLMILSIFFTYITAYFLLRKFGIKQVVAFVGAISIGLLAPQIFRMGGHYALSYSIAIPLTWLLLLRYKENPKLMCIALLAINNMFWLLIHAYLGIILIGFVAFYYLIDVALNLKLNIKNYKKHISFILSVVLPILVFELMLFFTDNHADRTSNPTGFFIYNAELDDILLPHAGMGFYRSFLDSFVSINQKWEGWAYIGFWSAMFFVFLVFSFVYSLATKKIKVFRNTYFDNKRLNLSLLSSIVLLVFSFGIPFKQFPSLLEQFSIFKQFRATGRFDWVFYFVFIVFSFYALNKLYVYLLEQKPYKAYIAIAVVFVVYLYEGSIQQYSMLKHMDKQENIFLSSYKDKLIPNEAMVEFSKYQAIIPMPFYHFGSEVFSVAGKLDPERISMLYSYHFGIPMLSAYLTRVSVSESKNVISMLSPTYYRKELANDITNHDKFLIIETKDKKSKYEKDVIERSEFLFSKDGYNFYQIKPEDLFKHTAKEDIAKFNSIKDSAFVYQDGFYLSDTSKYFYYNSFEHSPNKISFRGKGSGAVDKNVEKIIANFNANTFKEKTKYSLSIWAYNADWNLNEHFRFGLIEYNEKGDVWEQEFYPELSQMINGDWSLVEFDYTMKNKTNNLKLYTRGSVYSHGTIVYDDLLIYEYPLRIYKEIEPNKELFFNNHQIK